MATCQRRMRVVKTMLHCSAALKLVRVEASDVFEVFILTTGPLLHTVAPILSSYFVLLHSPSETGQAKRRLSYTNFFHTDGAQNVDALKALF